MKEVPKKDAPEVSGGVVNGGLVIPGYPLPPYNPGGPYRPPLLGDPTLPADQTSVQK